MFNSLVPRIAGDNEPPDASRHRLFRRRLGVVFVLAAALAVGFAMIAAPQPAHAVTAIDGQWTVAHGGTGLITLNTDGTYTSTCQVNPDYADAWCPAPAGTFQYSTMSTASVTFTGADGSTTSYRVSGPVSNPDTITSVFGSRTNSPLMMKKGTQFVCTDWSVRRGVNPLVEYDPASNLYYLTGSHQLLTTDAAAETAPNYFQTGYCAEYATPPAPATIMHVNGIRDASVSDILPGLSRWIPQATVTIKNLVGAAVSGATVNGSFTDAGISGSCVTVADGTCTIGGDAAVGDTLPSSQFTTDSVIKNGLTWDGQHAAITVYDPNLTTPTPATHHVGDLDNATAATRSPSSNWQPKVTSTVLDANGAAVAGATISGTFSGHRGTLTCTTTANGTCTVGNFTLSGSTSSTVFTVTNIIKASSTYQPKANSDPDGDSNGNGNGNGTTITIKHP